MSEPQVIYLQFQLFVSLFVQFQTRIQLLYSIYRPVPNTIYITKIPDAHLNKFLQEFLLIIQRNGKHISFRNPRKA
jgi:hypothetical protein